MSGEGVVRFIKAQSFREFIYVEGIKELTIRKANVEGKIISTRKESRNRYNTEI